MTIRTMTIDDYEQVYALWCNTPEMRLNPSEDGEAEIARYLARNPGTCFVAETDDKIVGVVLSGHDGRRGFLHHMAVARQEQRHGVGGALVSTALSALRRAGISKVALLCFNNNDKGNTFWEKQGFAAREDLIYRDKFIDELTRGT